MTVHAPHPDRHRFSAVRNERGETLVVTACTVLLTCIVAAFVVDIGHAFWAKRALQRSADAAALAGAQSLPSATNARKYAERYSGSPLTEGRLVQGEGCLPTDLAAPACWTNHSIAGTSTIVCVPGDAPRPDVANCGEPNKVVVEETATVQTFFAGVFGKDSVDVHARAVVSRPAIVSTIPAAPIGIYVHELCGNKGFEAGGKNIKIEGGIHSNGNFKVGDSGFSSTGKATIYRDPPGGTPAQRSGCTTSDVSDSRYNGTIGDPQPTTYRPWVTPYHSPQLVKADAPCTHSPSGDVKFENVALTASQQGVYCLAAGKKFTLAGNVTGPGGTPARITVIADIIEVGGTGKLAPYCMSDTSWARPATCKSDVNVLFYSSGGAPWPAGSEAPTTPSTQITVNPSGAFDWSGFIINRRGGIVINAAGVTSPLKGLLEAEWVVVNGENFTMLGTHPDPSESETTTSYGAVRMDE